MSLMRAPLWEYSVEAIRAGLRRIAESGDVYIATLYLWTAPSTDVRWSSVSLMWDTEERCAARSAGQPEQDLPGLRWSWQHHQRGDGEWWDRDSDPVGHEALERWARGQGLWFEGVRDAYDDAERDLALELSDRLVTGLIELISKLHADGTVESQFGRAIPFTLIAHDSHQPFPEWNQHANPPELYAQVAGYYESIWGPG
jgi:hypothetical protein